MGKHKTTHKTSKRRQQRNVVSEREVLEPILRSDLSFPTSSASVKIEILTKNPTVNFAASSKRQDFYNQLAVFKYHSRILYTVEWFKPFDPTKRPTKDEWKNSVLPALESISSLNRSVAISITMYDADGPQDLEVEELLRALHSRKWLIEYLTIRVGRVYEFKHDEMWNRMSLQAFSILKVLQETSPPPSLTKTFIILDDLTRAPPGTVQLEKLGQAIQEATNLHRLHLGSLVHRLYPEEGQNTLDSIDHTPIGRGIAANTSLKHMKVPIYSIDFLESLLTVNTENKNSSSALEELHFSRLDILHPVYTRDAISIIRELLLDPETAVAVPFSKLRTLRLSGQGLESAAVDTLLSSCRHPALETLDVQGNVLRDLSFPKFLSRPKNQFNDNHHCWKKLVLYNNPVCGNRNSYRDYRSGRLRSQGPEKVVAQLRQLLTVKPELHLDCVAPNVYMSQQQSHHDSFISHFAGQEEPEKRPDLYAMWDWNRIQPFLPSQDGDSMAMRGLLFPDICARIDCLKLPRKRKLNLTYRCLLQNVPYWLPFREDAATATKNDPRQLSRTKRQPSRNLVVVRAPAGGGFTAEVVCFRDRLQDYYSSVAIGKEQGAGSNAASKQCKETSPMSNTVVMPQQVLETHRIFVNAKKMEYASPSFLQRSFHTSNELHVASQILQRGKVVIEHNEPRPKPPNAPREERHKAHETRVAQWISSHYNLVYGANDDNAPIETIIDAVKQCEASIQLDPTSDDLEGESLKVLSAFRQQKSSALTRIRDPEASTPPRKETAMFKMRVAPASRFLLEIFLTENQFAWTEETSDNSLVLFTVDKRGGGNSPLSFEALRNYIRDFEGVDIV